MLKIGLIGAGFMGGTHNACYEALQANYDFKVTAVADLDNFRAQKIAMKSGAQVFKSGEELINNADVDVIDICLPTYMHTKHALMAMEKGCSVFIEKPVCLLESEAKKLLAMQKKTGATVMVGHCIRFWPEYIYLKSIIDKCTYGKVISAVFQRFSPKPEWAWEGWLHDIGKSGSATLDLHIHDVDYTRYVMGNPDSLQCSALSSMDHIYSLYKYEDKNIFLEGGWDFPASYPFEMSYRIKFEEAVVVFNCNCTPSVTIYLNNGTKIHPEIEIDMDNHSDGLGGNISSLGGYLNEIKYFIECLISGDPIKNATLQDGVESFRLVQQEIESALKK